MAQNAGITDRAMLLPPRAPCFRQVSAETARAANQTAFSLHRLAFFADVLAEKMGATNATIGLMQLLPLRADMSASATG